MKPALKACALAIAVGVALTGCMVAPDGGPVDVVSERPPPASNPASPRPTPITEPSATMDADLIVQAGFSVEGPAVKTDDAYLNPFTGRTRPEGSSWSFGGRRVGAEPVTSMWGQATDPQIAFASVEERDGASPRLMLASLPVMGNTRPGTLAAAFEWDALGPGGATEKLVYLGVRSDGKAALSTDRRTLVLDLPGHRQIGELPGFTATGTDGDHFLGYRRAEGTGGICATYEVVDPQEPRLLSSKTGGFTLDSNAEFGCAGGHGPAAAFLPAPDGYLTADARGRAIYLSGDPMAGNLKRTALDTPLAFLHLGDGNVAYVDGPDAPTGSIDLRTGAYLWKPREDDAGAMHLKYITGEEAVFSVQGTDIAVDLVTGDRVNPGNVPLAVIAGGYRLEHDGAWTRP